MTNSINNETLDVWNLKFHDLANSLPMLSDKEIKKLSADIKKNGQQEPIVIYEGKILDGRNRYEACKLYKKVPDMKEYKGNNPLEYVISTNLMRRHLSSSQRAIAAVEIATLKRGANQHTSIEGCSQDEAAKLFKVSKSSVQRAAQVKDGGIDDLWTSVKEGKLSVGLAVGIARLTKEEQKEVLALGSKGKIIKRLKGDDQHPSDCKCGKCPASKVHNVTLTFTNAELNAITKAKSRYDFTSSTGGREDFLRYLILEACDEKNLPISKSGVNKMNREYEKYAIEKGLEGYEKHKGHPDHSDYLYDMREERKADRDALAVSRRGVPRKYWSKKKTTTGIKF